MVNKQDFAKLILADKVEILLGVDDFNAVISSNVKSVHPKFTEVTRGGRQKFYEPTDAKLTFEIELTEDIIDELIVKHTRVNKILPTFAWTFKMVAKDGTTNSLVINGELSELEFDAPETGPAHAICGIEMSDQILD